jgi:flagellar basal-body rod protein FlgG
MFDALQIAATGMQAQQMNVDTVANNLANVNTIGYKKSRIGFADLVSAGAARATASDAASGLSRPVPEALAKVGAGVRIAVISKLFDQGDVRKTDAPMDVLIAGEGFLEVTLPDGARGYFRGGTLKVNADGMLASPAGFALKPEIAVPAHAESLVISTDGKVSAKMPNQASPQELGTLEMARFTNASALDALGDGLYRPTELSGEPMSGRAGEDGMGLIRQGQLEGSNVKLVDEMVNLMVAQRAYEASVKVAQASDEMLGLINNLRK